MITEWNLLRYTLHSVDDCRATLEEAVKKLKATGKGCVREIIGSKLIPLLIAAHSMAAHVETREEERESTP